MTARASRPRGPRGADADTRADILRAAGELFTTVGYERTSIRAVARAAGVDPALPRHYFPSKSALFVEAVGPIQQIDDHIGEVLDGPVDQLGRRMIEAFLTVWDSPVTGPRLQTLLMSAAAAPEVGQTVKDVLYNRLFLRIARGAGPDDVEARASAALSQMVGLAVARYVLRVEPLASATRDELVTRFAPNVQRLITGDRT